MKKLFTLIELIVVIAVLGILAAIIIPNISSFQDEANDTAILSNVRNLQTGVDMYGLENNGIYPTYDGQPTEFIPKPIDFEEMHPDYTRNIPKTVGAKYWVDAWGKVWASTVDSPEIEVSNLDVIWSEIPDASAYQIFEVTNYNVSSKISNKKSQLKPIIKRNKDDFKEGLKFTGEVNRAYVVSAIDENGFPSAPSGVGYIGYINPTQPKIDNSIPNLNTGPTLFSQSTGRGIHGDVQTSDQINTTAPILEVLPNKQIKINLTYKEIGAIGDFEINDEVLLHSAKNGTYIFAHIESIENDILTLTTSKDLSLFSNSLSQVVKVAEFNNFETTGTINTHTFSDTRPRGGIIVMKVNNKLTINHEFNANGRNYSLNTPGNGYFGGRYAGAGGGSLQFRGGYGGNSGSYTRGNPGSILNINNDLKNSKLYFGGKGGGGNSGGNGGGIIIVIAKEIEANISYPFQANGNKGFHRGGSNGGTGGGAGGSILIAANIFTNFNNYYVSANGGGGGGGMSPPNTSMYAENGKPTKGGRGAYSSISSTSSYATGGLGYKSNGGGGGGNGSSGTNASDTQGGNGGSSGSNKIYGGGGGGGGGYVAIYSSDINQINQNIIHSNPFYGEITNWDVFLD